MTFNPMMGYAVDKFRGLLPEAPSVIELGRVRLIWLKSANLYRIFISTHIMVLVRSMNLEHLFDNTLPQCRPQRHRPSMAWFL